MTTVMSQCTDHTPKYAATSLQHGEKQFQLLLSCCSMIGEVVSSGIHNMHRHTQEHSVDFGLYILGLSCV